MQRTAPEDLHRQPFEEWKELEKQTAKEALLLVQKKHKLFKVGGERERARTMQKLENCPSFGSCSASLAFDTDEAMSTSSRMAQEVDEAMSEASWTALAKENSRCWWSIDVEGGVEELEVGSPWTGTEGDSMDHEGEVNHKSGRKKGGKRRRGKVGETEGR